MSITLCILLAFAGGIFSVAGCGDSTKSSEKYTVPSQNDTPPATNDAQSRRHGERSNGAQ
ncbi:MAG TPA: hypothetical protein VMI31_00445 [Fimbriimonadaceae bacterium]|nr:hypothetical protein [Fimbriimonadaceae bacterium]